MFTGIIEGTAKVLDIGKSRGSRSAMRMTLSLGKISAGMKPGDSLAVNGACLTVRKLSKGNAEFEMIGETMKRTSLGSIMKGDKVNVERSLKSDGRIEGHFVLGHVDGVGKITGIKKMKTQVDILITIPSTLTKYVVEKGSITIEGISLTVVAIKGTSLTISLIPHTMEIANMSHKKIGDRVNVEADILAKYIAKQKR
ncbi:MAG TPA: riboflavin synthase [Candidatus Acidoferrales bacterium]|nr:riboflavin synthase [Candidatus Acidoferrales bacterium]